MPVPSLTPVPIPPELPDLELARRVASGEPELFELLMRRHNQRLFRVVRGVVDHDTEAEDVLQDAWVRAFEHLGSFPGELLSLAILSHQIVQRRCQGRHVAGWYQNAIDPIPDDLARSAGTVEADDRKTARHGFAKHHSEPLVAGRQHEEIGAPHLVERMPGHSGKPDPILEARVSDDRLQQRTERAFAPDIQ